MALFTEISCVLAKFSVLCKCQIGKFKNYAGDFRMGQSAEHGRTQQDKVGARHAHLILLGAPSCFR